jgi:type I restriction enzyme, S subunit
MREDWEETEIGDVAKLYQPKTISSKMLVIDGKYDVYGANGIIGKYDKFNHEEKELLITCRGATCGNVHITKPFSWINGNAMVVKPFDQELLSLEYLKFVFSNKGRIQKAISGTAQPQITRSTLSPIKIPIAPLPEQRAIVSKIEELFSDLDKGIDDLKKAQDQLVIFRQAVLKKAFEGELTKGWREQQTNLPTAEELLEEIKDERQKHYEQQILDWKKAVKDWEKNGKEGKKPTVPKKSKDKTPLTESELKDLFKLQEGSTWRKIGETCSVKGGKRLPKGQTFSKEKTAYNYIMAGNLKGGTVSQEVNYINKETYDALYHYHVNKGDAYITIVGACIGDAGVIPESHHLSILTENAAKIICTSSLSSKYLSFWLNSIVAQMRIKRSIFSMTLGKLALNRIEEIELPLCSIEEQHQIIQEIESRLSVCDKVEQSITDSLEKAKALRQSILKKAFEGSLLSGEEIAACKAAPDYEPASVLLEKIKAEKKK